MIRVGQDFFRALRDSLAAGDVVTAQTMVESVMLAHNLEPRKSSGALRVERYRARQKALQTPVTRPVTEGVTGPVTTGVTSAFHATPLARAEDLSCSDQISENTEKTRSENTHSDARCNALQPSVTAERYASNQEPESSPWLVVANAYRVAYEAKRSRTWMSHERHRPELTTIALVLASCAKQDSITLRAAADQTWANAWAEPWLAERNCPIGTVARDPARWYAPPKGKGKLGRYEPSPDDFAHVDAAEEAAQ